MFRLSGCFPSLPSERAIHHGRTRFVFPVHYWWIRFHYPWRCWRRRQTKTKQAFTHITRIHFCNHQFLHDLDLHENEVTRILTSLRTFSHSSLTLYFKLSNSNKSQFRMNQVRVAKFLVKVLKILLIFISLFVWVSFILVLFLHPVLQPIHYGFTCLIFFGVVSFVCKSWSAKVFNDHI